MRRARRLAAFLACTFLACTFVAALASAARADVDVRAVFGHDGSWVSDAATPCVVTLRNRSAAPVEVTLVIRQSGFGNSDTLIVERTVALGANATRDEAFIVPGPSGFAPNVELDVATTPRTPIHAGQVTGDRGRLSFAIVDPRQSHGTRPGEERAIGVIGDRSSVLSSRLSGREMDLKDKDKPAIVHGARLRIMAVDPGILRLAPLGLDGLESLVLVDPDSSMCADPADLDALLDWVALGGRLVVSLGENAPLFAASPLAASMPARWGSVGRGDYAEFARRIGVRSPEPFPREGPHVEFLDAASVRRDADGLRDADDWVAARDYGSGRIVLLAFDARAFMECIPPEDRPISKAARPIAGPSDPRPWKTDENGWNEQMDVSSKVGGILPQDAFQPPPLPAVLLGLFIYVLVVGPGDWLVLKRLRKERLTTFTFAGAVIVFTVLAYGASIFLFSTKAMVNRIITVQYAHGGRPGRELVRFHDLAGYFEPISATRELTHGMPAAFLGRSFPGLPPTGGVGAALPLEIRGNDPLAPKATMEIAFRSQRTIHVCGAGTTGRTVDVVRGGGGAESVTVTSSLSVPLLDAWVFLPGGSYIHVGPLAAGATTTASGAAPVASLGWETSGDVPWQPGTNSLSPEQFRTFLASVVTATINSAKPPESYESLRRAGIVQRSPGGRRALFLAIADECPITLPALEEPGRRHVVISKEVELE